MKTPIEPADIRKGDLIRTEASEGSVIGDNLTASEWRADGSEDARHFNDVRLYLLDRPAVELPTEATLGWATLENGERLCGSVRIDTDRRWVYVDDRGLHVEAVTAFTPATAVPTAALDELHALVAKAYERGTDITAGSVGRILATITEANR